MKNRAFTLIEMIIVIVIAGILSAGTFVAIKQIYIRANRSKAISELSQDSQLIASQIASLLYDRVPSSVIGYDTVTKKFRSIYDLNGTYNVLEWISTAQESLNHRDYSGFIDMDSSDPDTNTLVSPDTNLSQVAKTIDLKFNTTKNVYDNALVALMFSGAFDSGSLVLLDDFDSSFGWHGNTSKLIYKIDSSSKEGNITLKTHPDEIYEKYYLVDSAYAIARGADLNRTVIEEKCHLDLSFIKGDKFNSTLFLFYNYRPWRNETFCGDPNTLHSETKEGNATILATEVEGFRADIANDNLQLSLTLKRDISSDKKHSVSISKQKVVF